MNKIHKFSGFTLIELILIIVLVSILISIGAPKFFSKKRYNSPLFCDQMVTTIRYAQKIAIATGCLVQVGITNNSVVLQRAHNCSSGLFDTAINHSFIGIDSIKNIPADIAVNTGDFPIYFDGLGRAYSSNTNTIQEQYTMTIDGLTITTVGETGYTYVL